MGRHKVLFKFFQFFFADGLTVCRDGDRIVPVNLCIDLRDTFTRYNPGTCNSKQPAFIECAILFPGHSSQNFTQNICPPFHHFENFTNDETEGLGISHRQKTSKIKRSFSSFLEPNERKSRLICLHHHGRIDSSRSL